MVDATATPAIVALGTSGPSTACNGADLHGFIEPTAMERSAASGEPDGARAGSARIEIK